MFPQDKMVSDLVEKRKNELIELASKLIQIPSVNPPGDVSELAYFIKDYLSNYGISTETYEPEKNRITVIGKVGKKNGRTLIFNGHMDTVPIGDRNRWSFDPFSGKVVNNILYGRGACDMKGGLAALMFAQILLTKFENEINGRLLLMAVPDEETGSAYGTKWCLENDIVKGDACVLGEPSLLKLCRIGEKGWFVFKMVTEGKIAHGSTPMLGENAILKMLNVVMRLQELTKKKVKVPQEYEEIIEQSKNFLAEVTGNSAVGDVLDHLTMNFGVIRGGVKVNVVPDRCEMEVDCRIPVGLTVSEVLAQINKAISDIKGVRVEVINATDPTVTSPKEEIVQILYEKASKLTEERPILYIQQSATDARFFRLKGIPAFSYGPGNGIKYAHAYNEQVHVKEIINAAKVYLATALSYLK